MTAWTRTKKIVGWVAVNGACWLLLALGTVGGLAWAFNVWAFATWFFTLLYIFVSVVLVLSALLETKVEPINAEFGVPKVITFLSDFAMAIFAAATGHWFYAWLVIIEQFSEQIVRRQMEAKSAKTPVAS